MFDSQPKPSPKPDPSSRDDAGLPAEVRTEMETLFEADFAAVRVHTGSPRARDAGAAALAEGDDIHIADHDFDPCGRDGRSVLGHELAHVLQQRGAGSAPGAPVVADEALEAEADGAAERVARGEAVRVTGRARAPMAQPLGGTWKGKEKDTDTEEEREEEDPGEVLQVEPEVESKALEARRARRDAELESRAGALSKALKGRRGKDARIKPIAEALAGGRLAELEQLVRRRGIGGVYPRSLEAAIREVVKTPASLTYLLGMLANDGQATLEGRLLMAAGMIHGGTPDGGALIRLIEGAENDELKAVAAGDWWSPILDTLSSRGLGSALRVTFGRSDPAREFAEARAATAAAEHPDAEAQRTHGLDEFRALIGMLEREHLRHRKRKLTRAGTIDRIRAWADRQSPEVRTLAIAELRGSMAEGAHRDYVAYALGGSTSDPVADAWALLAPDHDGKHLKAERSHWEALRSQIEDLTPDERERLLLCVDPDEPAVTQDDDAIERFAERLERRGCPSSMRRQICEAFRFGAPAGVTERHSRIGEIDRILGRRRNPFARNRGRRLVELIASLSSAEYCVVVSDQDRLDQIALHTNPAQRSMIRELLNLSKQEQRGGLEALPHGDDPAEAQQAAALHVELSARHWAALFRLELGVLDPETGHAQVDRTALLSLARRAQQAADVRRDPAFTKSFLQEIWGALGEHHEALQKCPPVVAALRDGAPITGEHSRDDARCHDLWRGISWVTGKNKKRELIAAIGEYSGRRLLEEWANLDELAADPAENRDFLLDIKASVRDELAWRLASPTNLLFGESRAFATVLAALRKRLADAVEHDPEVQDVLRANGAPYDKLAAEAIRVHAVLELSLYDRRGRQYNWSSNKAGRREEARTAIVGARRRVDDELAGGDRADIGPERVARLKELRAELEARGAEFQTMRQRVDRFVMFTAAGAVSVIASLSTMGLLTPLLVPEIGAGLALWIIGTTNAGVGALIKETVSVVLKGRDYESRQGAMAIARDVFVGGVTGPIPMVNTQLIAAIGAGEHGWGVTPAVDALLKAVQQQLVRAPSEVTASYLAGTAFDKLTGKDDDATLQQRVLKLAEKFVASCILKSFYKGIGGEAAVSDEQSEEKLPVLHRLEGDQAGLLIGGAYVTSTGGPSEPLLTALDKRVGARLAARRLAGAAPLALDPARIALRLLQDGLPYEELEALGFSRAARHQARAEHRREQRDEDQSED